MVAILSKYFMKDFVFLFPFAGHLSFFVQIQQNTCFRVKVLQDFITNLSKSSFLGAPFCILLFKSSSLYHFFEAFSDLVVDFWPSNRFSLRSIVRQLFLEHGPCPSFWRIISSSKLSKVSRLVQTTEACGSILVGRFDAAIRCCGMIG